MRGNRGKGKNRRVHNVWRSYSDMMAGLLLLFILVMSIALFESQRSYEAELESKKEQEKLLEEVKEQAEEVEQQKKQLKEQTNQLEEQKKIMEEQQKKIDKIIGIKAELIAQLREEFAAHNLSVGIDEETGAITFDSNVLFAYDESILTEEGKSILSQMLPIYCKSLMEDTYQSYLSQIIVDGFTDTKGDYEYNLKLSQDRAFAVAEYLLSIKDTFLTPEQASVLESKLTANGRSKSNPILDENGEVNMDASRRVEVKFRLKDEEMIKELHQIMSSSSQGD
ncbi:MAG: OmpA family protein [Eubacteriales bacterium]|nr:OmpA family protein [Eubacteriales bacterium]